MSVFQIVVLGVSGALLYAVIGFVVYGAIMEHWVQQGIRVDLPYRERSREADQKKNQAEWLGAFWLFAGLAAGLFSLACLLVRTPSSKLKKLGGKLYKEVVDPKNNV